MFPIARKVCRRSELVVRRHSSACPAHEADHVACLLVAAPFAGNRQQKTTRRPRKGHWWVARLHNMQSLELMVSR